MRLATQQQLTDKQVLSHLKHRVNALNHAIALLENHNSSLPQEPATKQGKSNLVVMPRKRRKMSAATKLKISRATKKRWKERKAG